VLAGSRVRSGDTLVLALEFFLIQFEGQFGDELAQRAGGAAFAGELDSGSLPRNCSAMVDLLC